MIGETVLGQDVDTGRPVLIDEHARSRSVYVIGITGTGKSTLLEQIAYQDILRGDGLCFLDPHGDSAERLLAAIPPSRADDVIYWDPADAIASSPDEQRFFGLNPFWCSDPSDPRLVDRTVDYFLAALRNLAAFSEAFRNAPLMTNMLRQMAVAFVANPGMTLAETPTFLEDAAFRRRFYSALSETHPQVRRFWERFDTRPVRQQREETASSLNKLYPFQTTDIMRMTFGQASTAVNLRSAMDERRILIIRLSEAELGPDTAGIIGAFVVFNILRAALSRADQAPKDRVPFHLIADEFQTFMTTAFPQLQEQSRKFGVDSAVAHQSREQLDETLRERTRAVQNLIVFRITGANAVALATEFDRTPREAPAQHQEFQRALAPYPLKHLAQHGHINPDTVTAYKNLIGEVTRLAQSHAYRHLQNAEGAISESVIYERLLLPLDNCLHAYLQECLQEKPSLAFYPPPFLNKENEEVIIHMLGPLWAARDDGIKSPVSPETRAYYRRYYDGLRAAWEAYNKEMQPVIAESRRLRATVKPLDSTQLYRNGWRIDEEEEIKLRQDAQRAVFSRDGKPCTHTEWFYPQELHARRHFPQGLPMTSSDRTDSIHLEAYSYDDPSLHHVLVRMPHPFNCVTQELRLMDLLSILAYKLADAPPMVATGQLQDHAERTRAYSDVESQIANDLSTLPQFHARCKLSGSGGLFETTIVTEPFAPPLDAQVARSIVEQSRSAYGVSRREVEGALKRRLKEAPSSGIMNSIRHGEQADDHEPGSDPSYWDTANGEGDDGAATTGSGR